MAWDGAGGVRRVAGLAVVVFTAAAALSIRAGYDLILQRASFPAWFVPAFVAGLAVLLAWAGAVTVRIWRNRAAAQPAQGRLATVVWLLIPLSFVCTSTVHQLYPFRPSLPAALREVGPVLRFNIAFTGLGFAAAAVLAVLYLAGRRRVALPGLLVLGLLLLVPNDDCANPFNTWWLATVGASPLMFVPNLYVILFAAGALLGVWPRWNALAVAAACVGVALLGLGHMTRVIW
jgi:hypothetical protein